MSTIWPYQFLFIVPTINKEAKPVQSFGALEESVFF
jgi:hypothetical protein